MKRLHEGWDYKLYNIYIWGGLPLLVIYLLVAILIFDAVDLPGPKAFLVLGGPILGWFAGIVLYWWWVFLYKGNQELKELAQAPREDFPGIN